MGLNRELILGTALALVDEHGLSGFTQRALGARLGVSQMAVYHYFPNKSAIIDALADEVMDGIRLDQTERDDTDPAELIIGYAVSARRVLLEHPALVPVVVARPLARATREEDLLHLVAVFTDAGFTADAIPDVALTILSVSLGLVLLESERATYDRAQGPSYAADRAELADSMRDGDGDVAEAATELVDRYGHDPADVAFEMAIRALYRGLAAQHGLGV